MTSQKYEQTRSCGKCGYEETRFLDELTAAFKETRLWNEPCSKCSSTNFSRASNSLPPLSLAQLEIWAINDKLTFLEQDEDLILATPDNLGLLLEFLDSPSTHIRQKRVLASALYILWYDTHPETGEDYLQNVDFAEKVAKEINKRTSLFIELGAEKAEEFGEPLWYLSSYVREAFEKHKS
jgi:predicted nucleic-acid-binding Zn-ribbon protein